MKFKVGDRIHLTGHPGMQGIVLSRDPGWKSYKVRFDTLRERGYDLSEISLTSLVVEPDECEAFFV